MIQPRLVALLGLCFVASSAGSLPSEHNLAPNLMRRQAGPPKLPDIKSFGSPALPGPNTPAHEDTKSADPTGTPSQPPSQPTESDTTPKNTTPKSSSSPKDPNTPSDDKKASTDKGTTNGPAPAPATGQPSQNSAASRRGLGTRSVSGSARLSKRGAPGHSPSSGSGSHRSRYKSHRVNHTAPGRHVPITKPNRRKPVSHRNRKQRNTHNAGPSRRF
ncbi:hypothetical protein DXG01_007112 [Tephrocybe rancida]|nr:hypothetical protein DXG01_007112 [Tephrocybe rancida]